jgi:predicted ATP-grasp superfamily ATP-dependent carboligase
MKYIKIHKSDLNSIDWNTLNDFNNLLGYHLKDNDSMIFTVPDSETFMPNKTQLTEEEFNQEVGSNEPNFVLPGDNPSRI